MSLPVRLAIVGDVVLQEPLPPSPALQRALGVLQTADIAFGNLEAPVSRRGAPADKMVRMRMHPDCVADLRRIGFRVMTVANNHILDYGPEAFSDTLSNLREAGIAPAGGGRDLREAWTPVLVREGGVTVAFLGAASTLPPGSAAGEMRAGIAPIHIVESYERSPTSRMEQPGSAPFVHTRAWPEDIQAAQEAVEEAAGQADFVVVAVHWGVPPPWRAPLQGDLAEYQPSVGHALVEAGADLVVGHHPHSLQGIEVVHGKPIFYSLGNFVFHHGPPRQPSKLARNAPYHLSASRDRQWSESIILDVCLNGGGATDYGLWPLLLDDAGNPHLLEGDEGEEVLQRLAELSEPLGAELLHAGGRGRLEV